jgi:deoxyribonuclease-4
MPTASRLVQAAEQAHALGCEAMQLFASNPTGWRQPAGGVVAAEAFAAAVRRLNLDPVVIHAPYLINLASPQEDIFCKSVDLLRWTACRAALLGARYVVFHIGSHRGAGIAAGINRLVAGVRATLTGIPDEVMLLLENDVGSGSELGGALEHMATALTLLARERDRVGVCLDTAHLWGAGYDVGTPAGVEAVVARCAGLMGAERIPVVHLNDTPTPFAGHRDLHARIGEGQIGLAGFRALLTHPALCHVAFILETPIKPIDERHADWEHDARYLAQVRALADAPIGSPEEARTVTKQSDAKVLHRNPFGEKPGQKGCNLGASGVYYT